VKPFLLAALIVVCAPALFGEDPVPPRISLARITQPITVDGDLSDAGWSEATVIDTFYEFTPGDGTEPAVRTIARVGLDDRFFYASFWCEEPDPRRIRAPYVDRDGVTDQQDYVGILLDVDNARRSAVDYWIGPNGIQTDTILTESPFGEDAAPDFFWESAGRIGADSWTVEVAIPLSSLRYPRKDPQDWSLIVYRVYPRDFNYQFYSVRLPRGSSCFLCWGATVEGIAGLPQGAHYVVAPYAASLSTKTYPGADGYSGDGQVTKGKVGVDAKWLPNAGTVVDATLNPDFSQVESDVTQIGVNQRFALFYPEKRPFFLEQVDLLQTPIQAVYTRTITNPFWGARLTGRQGSSSYTVLASDDRGGGTVIIPAPVFSASAPQDFESYAAVTRIRHDLGASFASALGTARVIEGGGYNYVLGGDFQWRPNDADSLTGQYLYSFTRNPERPDLYPGWQGQKLSGFGWTAEWFHSTRNWNWSLQHDDFATGFRADDGFVPQVGYRKESWDLAYRTYPTGFFSRLQPLTGGEWATARDGSLLSRRIFPGFSFQAKGALRGELDYNFEAVAIDGTLLEFDRFVWNLAASPSRLVPSVSFTGNYGEQADVSNVRVGTGGTIGVAALVRPTSHLGLDLLGERQWIDETVNGRSGRLFTAQTARVKATYVFTARMLVRLIGQYVEIERDPSLWTFPVPAKEGGFAGSALFSYKLNWQTVLFVGYGDNRTLQESGDLTRADRQFFLKVSYAFQR
jgi:Domain of unknown function (DUF5916)